MSLLQNRVFGVIAAQANDEGNAGARNGQTSDEHRVSGPRHLFDQAAHLGHLVGVNGVDHRPGAKEQKALEKRMGNQVHHARKPSANANGQHHVAKLANCGIGQHAFNVGRGNGDGGRHKQGNSAGHGDNQQNLGRKERVESCRQVTEQWLNQIAQNLSPHSARKLVS